VRSKGGRCARRAQRPAYRRGAVPSFAATPRDGQQDHRLVRLHARRHAPYTLHQGSFDSSLDAHLFSCTQLSIEAAVARRAVRPDICATASHSTLIRRVAAYMWRPGPLRPLGWRNATAVLATRHRKAHPQQIRRRQAATSVRSRQAPRKLRSTEANVPTIRPRSAADVHTGSDPASGAPALRGRPAAASAASAPWCPQPLGSLLLIAHFCPAVTARSCPPLIPPDHAFP